MFSGHRLDSIVCATKFTVQFLHVMPWIILQLFWKCSSFPFNLIVRFLNTGIIPHVFVTSFHRSWQNIFILLRFLLLYLFYISILFVCTVIKHCSVYPPPSPGSHCQTLPSSESPQNQVWIAHVSFIPHCLLSWIFMVMPYFSYYSY